MYRGVTADIDQNLQNRASVGSGASTTEATDDALHQTVARRQTEALGALAGLVLDLDAQKSDVVAPGPA